MSEHVIRENRADLFISIGLIVFCVFAAVQTAQLRTPPSNSIAGPAFMPWIMVILIGLSSLMLLGRSLARQKQGASATLTVPGKAVLGKMAAVVVIMLAYALMLMPLGYIWSTLIVVAVGLLVLGERNLWILAIFPAAMTSAVYFGFTKLLSVWLP